MALSFLKLESSFSDLFQLEYLGDFDFDGALMSDGRRHAAVANSCCSREQMLQSRTASVSISMERSK